MKKIYLFLVLTLSLISCSVDETPEINSTPIGLEGPEFKMVITYSPSEASVSNAIINEENKPIFNTNHWLNDSSAIIQENTGVALLLVDNQFNGQFIETFRVTLYSHYFGELSEPIVFEISYNDFQPQDYLVFTVGENAIITEAKIHRNYNGSQSMNDSTIVGNASVTQL